MSNFFTDLIDFTQGVEEDIQDSSLFSSEDLENEADADSVSPGVGGENDERELVFAQEFSVSFQGDGDTQTFKFALMPAVDDGNETTEIPEIKPGILKKTNMQIKRFTIPGRSPVFQMMGIRETILQCVGLIVGTNEGLNVEPEPEELYNPNYSNFNAYSAALQFDREVTQRGATCLLNISSDAGTNPVAITHNCLIQNYRYFINREDRVWFSLELVILDYSPGGTKFQEGVFENIVDDGSTRNREGQIPPSERLKRQDGEVESPDETEEPVEEPSENPSNGPGTNRT